MTLPAHAKLAPSGADTWMTCPGSVEAQDGLPDDTTEWSSEGTMAHDVSDFCLSYGLDAYFFVGATFRVPGTELVRNEHGLITGRRNRVWTYTWSNEDADFLQSGFDHLLEMGGELYGEHKVDISNWLGENQFGTLDRAIVWRDADVFLINDLKWGRGIPVSVRDSKQLRLYALGFWWNVARYFENMKSVILEIDQPRSWVQGGRIELTMDELLEFGEEVRPAAERALKPGAERIPSKAGCYWCKRRKAFRGCYAYDAWMLSLLGLTRAEVIDIEEFILGKTFTQEERANLVLHKTLIVSWLEKLQDDAVQDALTIGDVPGVAKAIEGRKLPDAWEDKGAADIALAKKLGDRRYKAPALITPQQALKLVAGEDRKDVEALIKFGLRKTELVPIDHPKPSIKSLNDQLAEMEDF
ncbi:DUF2800 domain-containing protein [Sphingobium lignivorans]|uniref:DUF2800 domain-containing protein n=1 Tax=Sphingobium lignivorans TaxID=2735886 RepID=A0ABR6NFF7_9SPHN|nr:DUF2800 domain-containing protein [Sphingobium lignivorans]MBB5986010.1 hypothetical protein [Sphingobium lignivorans]